MHFKYQVSWLSELLKCNASDSTSLTKRQCEDKNMNNAKVIILDLDGTVYQGNRLIGGADEFIEKMRSFGLRILFCTNNSSKPRSSIAKKLVELGIPCIEEDVISSGFMAVQYIISNDLKKVYVSGTEEFRMEFQKCGVDLVDETETDNLVLSMDMNFNYSKMTKAVRAALKSKKIIICNRDKLFPKEDGIYPGCGAMVASVLFCSDREADIVLGKPSTHMLEYASKITGYPANKMIVIGDSLESDIAMAEAYGSPSILIGSKREGGLWATTLKEIVEWD